jgi:eukaryotic-like serine/threonine-protein kinase
MDGAAGAAGAAGAGGDELVGTVLAGRYRILAKLGEGAMGNVYVGEHLTIGRRDAIKVLRPGLAQDTEAIARFTRGTRNVSAIQHPNVCTIYDFSDTPDGIRFLAMEFIEGDTLKDVIEASGRLDVDRALEITRQIAEGLQAAHDVGVVHRDLKPGNIMMCRRRDGRDLVKVVDFDIAKGPAEAEGSEVTRVGFVVGTPEYMSPEQLIGDRLDGRSDLYSLGVVLFRMLSGEMPFRATTTQELMMQRLTAEPLRLDEVMPDALPALQRVLARALARKPEDRQPSVAVFAEELAAAVGADRSVAAGAAASAATAAAAGAAPPPPAHVPEPELAPTSVVPARPARRGGRAWLVPGGIAVVALLSIVAFLATRPEPPATEPIADPATANTLDQLAAAASDSVGAVTDRAAGTTEPVTDAGSAATVREPPPREPAVQPAFVFPGGIAAMLDRHLDVLYGQPDAATLRAVRDSAERAWHAAVTRADSSTAALVLAQAAYRAADNAACVRWARRGLDLGGSGLEPLLAACQ